MTVWGKPWGRWPKEGASQWVFHQDWGGFQDAGLLVLKSGNPQENWVTLITLVFPSTHQPLCCQPSPLPALDSELSLPWAPESSPAPGTGARPTRPGHIWARRDRTRTEGWQPQNPHPPRAVLRRAPCRRFYTHIHMCIYEICTYMHLK